jgi:Fe-S cluster assembly protein SufD
MNATSNPSTEGLWPDALARPLDSSHPAWAKALREQAVTQLRRTGLPDRKTEAWKYTPMQLIAALDPGALPGEVPPRAAIFPDPLIAADIGVDIADGRLQQLPDSPPGLSLLPLSEALAVKEGRLQSLLESQDLSGRHRALAALNTAMLSEGLVILVEKGVNAGSLLLRWAFSKSEKARLGNFRLFVLLEAGARLELMEQFESRSESRDGLNLVSQIELGENARLEHLRLQRESDSSLLITETSVSQQRRSDYGYSGFDLGGRLVRHEVNVTLLGEDAQTEIRGAFVLDGKRYADNHISVDHAVGGCRSRQFFRGVLGGRSRGVFNGRALIREGADGSSVYQSNANLLLSELAEVDSKPELEIYADEVEASHGATVGQLDENAVFYLRTRGLSDAQARRMLTAAFCHAVTDRLENRALAQRLASRLDDAMPGDRETGS